MKISIGSKIKSGPWGGGNLFVVNLKEYLEERNHEVIFDLDDDDIEIILLTDPRIISESSSFDYLDVSLYKKFVNPNPVVFHRINECDERKNTNNINKFMLKANKVSDYTIFVSEWIKNLYIKLGHSGSSSVIRSGSNMQIFNRDFIQPWDKKSPLKIVTHHWGANWNKGFEVYQYIDSLLENNKWSEKIEFTYIGNVPKNFVFKNSKHIEPISGSKLSKELKKNNVYITGSLNEPSGNHHIEASQCGLPILYIDSGGVTEYCRDFGVEYNINDLEEKLEYISNNYDKYFEIMKKYPENHIKMCSEYLKLFESSNREVKLKKKNTVFKTIFKLAYKLKKMVKGFILNE